MMDVDVRSKRWALKFQASQEDVVALAKELNINNVLATLLIQRGVDTFDKARGFFRPSLNDLHDPFLMKDMDKAVDRLHKAIQAGEKILVYGDYDVDGTTSVALVFSFIHSFYPNVDYYLPDR